MERVLSYLDYWNIDPLWLASLARKYRAPSVLHHKCYDAITGVNSILRFFRMVCEKANDMYSVSSIFHEIKKIFYIKTPYFVSFMLSVA